MIKKRKGIIILIIIILLITLLHITGALPYIAARISATIYVNLHYSDMGLVFEKIEFSPYHDS